MNFKNKQRKSKKPTYTPKEVANFIVKHHSLLYNFLCNEGRQIYCDALPGNGSVNAFQPMRDQQWKNIRCWVMDQ